MAWVKNRKGIDRFFLVLLSISLSSFGTEAKNGHTTRYLHLPQFHTTEDNSFEEYEWIARSQFENAHQILEHPHAALIVEGITEKITRRDVKKEKLLMERARFLFPQGIPENFDDLSFSQRNFLANTGAAQTLLYLGKIHEILPAYSAKEEARIFNEVAEIRSRLNLKGKSGYHIPRIYELVFTERERLTAQSAQKAGKNYDEVLIIYGAAHDFSDDFLDLNLHNAFARISTPQISNLPRDAREHIQEPEWMHTLQDTIFPPGDQIYSGLSLQELNERFLTEIIILDSALKDLSSSLEKAKREEDLTRYADLEAQARLLSRDLTQIRRRLNSFMSASHSNAKLLKGFRDDQLNAAEQTLSSIRFDLQLSGTLFALQHLEESPSQVALGVSTRHSPLARIAPFNHQSLLCRSQSWGPCRQEFESSDFFDEFH